MNLGISANGQVVSGKRAHRPFPSTFVPPVDAENMREGLAIFRAALADAGNPEPYTAAWEGACSRVQAQLCGEWGEVILWRSKFLDALLRRKSFQLIHASDGELPTLAMLKVSGIISTAVGDQGFDLNEFEEMLIDPN